MAKTLKARRARLDIRLDEELLAVVEKEVKAKGYRSASDLVRALLRREVGPRAARPASVDIDYEKVIAASQNQVLGSLRKLHVAQRANTAFLFAFARAVCKYIPELPPADAKPSEHRANNRFAYIEKEAARARFDLLDIFEAEMQRRDEDRRPKGKV